MLAPATTGCVYHDTCIKVTSPGHDWCRNLVFAEQWPIGSSFDEAVPILRPDGGVPRGCRCYNDAETQIFEDKAPACRFEAFLDELELAARQECQSLVMPGYDHNCWTSVGMQASIAETHFPDGVGTCIGNCEYGGPPIGGSCPDPNPYECATGGGSDGGCASEGGDETSASDSGLDDTGSDTSGGMLLDIDALIACVELDCEVDRALARQLYVDPSPLLEQGTVLVHVAKLQRHVLQGVEPDSIVHALGLRSGDRLESVNGIVIRDLDSALHAYVQLGDATTLEVRIKRGSQWLDFTYTLVP
ncbi:PDZ domain-containing protein [Paraliomyxa miuraensis]|uniref:PDZ domain-containing protein n=1 Tax=Paraliomyxa miuraensis TaxID=376150 RepID=UPI00225760D1|nr:PDZ domain-containing protein [Paraliomyxa miuraensis]MCX4241906.1 PDZ domain-containing protein [Paraliomyxa miuraensis]